MRVIALLFAALLVSAGWSQAADVSEYTAGNSALKLAKRSDGGADGYFATFTGKLRLSGKLVIEFDRLESDTSSNRDTEGAAFFVPDAQGRADLPRAVGTFYPKEVSTIGLDKKPAELLPHVVGAQKTKAILRGTKPRYELPATLTIKSFSAWVECDHRGYSAEVLSIERVQATVVALSKPQFLGC